MFLSVNTVFYFFILIKYGMIIKNKRHVWKKMLKITVKSAERPSRKMVEKALNTQNIPKLMALEIINNSLLAKASEKQQRRVIQVHGLHERSGASTISKLISESLLEITKDVTLVELTSNKNTVNRTKKEIYFESIKFNFENWVNAKKSKDVSLMTKIVINTIENAPTIRGVRTIALPNEIKDKNSYAFLGNIIEILKLQKRWCVVDIGNCPIAQKISLRKLNTEEYIHISTTVCTEVFFLEKRLKEINHNISPNCPKFLFLNQTPDVFIEKYINIENGFAYVPWILGLKKHWIGDVKRNTPEFSDPLQIIKASLYCILTGSQDIYEQEVNIQELFESFK